jgi:integrase
MATNFTARMVANLKPAAKPFYVVDTTRLVLRVATNGSKTWSVRYWHGDGQRRLTLGAYPVLSLADARLRAKNALKLVEDGADPAELKRERRDADTVGDFAPIYIEKWAQPKKKSWKIDQMRLNIDVLPAWKRKLMRDVTRRDVEDLLDSIAKRPAPIVANRVRSLLHKMFAFAVKKEVVTSNPVTNTDRREEHSRDRVLTPDEIRTFWTACDALPLEMGAAFKLRLIAAQRGGEVFAMRWQDVDLESGWWTIPASGSKNGLAHRVPLSAPAIDLLTALHVKAQQQTKPSIYVFRNARGKRQQAEAVATFAIADFKGHDLRRTAASLMASDGVNEWVIGKILNHKDKGVTKIYVRHSYDNEKRIALDAWARTLTGIIEQKSGDVLAFARA